VITVAGKPGAVQCPIDRVCERTANTPIWAEVADAYDATKERVQVRERALEMALRQLK
jgi:hypothetical protein